MDIDLTCQFMQTEDYLRHVPIEPHTPESASAIFGRLMAAQTKQPRVAYHLIALDNLSTQFVGTIDMGVYLPWQLGEIGWAVVSSRAGEGLATEMSYAILRYGFDKLGLHRVQAKCSSENAASRRIMEKIGMIEEGVMRDNMFVRGRWWSTIQGAVLSTDPQARLATPVAVQKS